LHFAIPKGRMHQGVIALLADAGIHLKQTARNYRPVISLSGVEVKVLKPQNVVEMLHVGTRDCGFAGADWVAELEADVVEVFDTELDAVGLVVAAPTELLVDDGRLPTHSPMGGPLRVAAEMPRIARQWIERVCPQARLVRTFGATEVFPPEDADCIVDIAATGATLRANGLTIVDEVMRSSTRLYASHAAMNDDAKRARIEGLVDLLRGVLEGRRRVMMEVNIGPDSLEALVEILPCMRRPTVATLSGEAGFAVKAAVPKVEVPDLIPRIKAVGGSDIVVSPLAQVLP
ncbi:MAG: ATP phosphoribosyltransferase, partial [Myxococcota bacterium]